MKKNDVKDWEHFFDEWKRICVRQYELQSEIDELEKEKRKLLIDSLSDASKFDVDEIRSSLEKGNFSFL